jgi:hypothetical protein
MGSRQDELVSAQDAKITTVMYAVWITVAAVIVIATQLQTQSRFFVEDNRLRNLIVSIVPLVLGALIVVYFPHPRRDQVRARQKGPASKGKAGPRSRGE